MSVMGYRSVRKEKAKKRLSRGRGVYAVDLSSSDMLQI
jgi:hypothetical protein